MTEHGGNFLSNFRNLSPFGGFEIPDHMDPRNTTEQFILVGFQVTKTFSFFFSVVGFPGVRI